jgi:geranylgeranyl diphosphate synthase type II
MEAVTRIEQVLSEAFMPLEAAPPRLLSAMRHAVFPGGARLRPRLTYAVAMACRNDEPILTDGAAAAIELLHCASLVHDDLPCFDDSPLRRGKPSVHRAFGESVAVLAGDALILLAFQTLARAGIAAPARLATLLQIVGDSAGMPNGIVAGQAWECESSIEITRYHREKTGALFAAATAAGAAAAGAVPERWRELGHQLGAAYQVADDIRDMAATPEDIGKPTGRDQLLDRPSAALQLGLDGALDRLDELVEAAICSVPACPGRNALRALIRQEAARFLPKDLARRAA